MPPLVQRKKRACHFLGVLTQATQEVRVTTLAIQLKEKYIEVTRDDMMHLMWPYASLEDMDHMCTVFDHCRCLGQFFLGVKKDGEIAGKPYQETWH